MHKHAVGQPLRSEFHTGFVYSDAWVQDARLVVLNAMDAQARGATILPRTRCVKAVRSEAGWSAELEAADGSRRTVTAKALVNAAGPWAVQFLSDVAGVGHDHALRLIKGSHIVVPRMFEHRYAYIFQQPDRRIVFAIPYEHDYTLIGTTDLEYKADPATPQIDADETRYLCDAVNRYFERAITPDDVVWSYSGVRPLLDDNEDNASEITRDYQLEFDTDGGKPLPGGERRDLDVLQRELQQKYPWLPEPMAWRLVHNYGTRSATVLGAATSLAGLGKHFGADLYQAEVDYLCQHEWAVSADDILWRRSKLGLRVDAAEAERLAGYLAEGPPVNASLRA
jgi:glycerol-3-phosphate dehydrogenase